MNVSIDHMKSEDDDEDIYNRVKALVRTHELPPNTHLLASQLSDKLGHCEEQTVEAALVRLVREGLVVEIPYKGFFTRKFSGVEICKLYEVNKIILDRSLEVLENNPDLGEIIQFSKIFPMEKNMRGFHIPSSDEYVQITHALFMHIVIQSARLEFIRIALPTSERLNYIRSCEYSLIDSPEEELSHLCHLYNRKDIKKLRHAVKEYHTSRFKIIPKLMEIL